MTELILYISVKRGKTKFIKFKLKTTIMLYFVYLIFRLPDLDNNRGGAELWTKVKLDREEMREIPILVHLEDSGGISATRTITVIVNDVNDNLMKPGNKSVSLWKTKVLILIICIIIIISLYSY